MDGFHEGQFRSIFISLCTYCSESIFYHRGIINTLERNKQPHLQSEAQTSLFEVVKHIFKKKHFYTSEAKCFVNKNIENMQKHYFG